MASVVTFGQLPEEEPAFLAYLQTTGDIRARAVNDDPGAPQYAPQPVALFLEKHAAQIVAYSKVAIYLGFRGDIFNPTLTTHERKSIDPMGSRYVRYDRGQFRTAEELASSNLCFYRGSFQGQTWIAHPQSFLKWGNKILSWMRRRTPELVPVDRCNYKVRATVGVSNASKKGLRLR